MCSTYKKRKKGTVYITLRHTNYRYHLSLLYQDPIFYSLSVYNKSTSNVHDFYPTVSAIMVLVPDITSRGLVIFF